MELPDYEFYKNKYGGTVLQEEFSNAMFLRANSIVSRIEHLLVVNYLDAVDGRKSAICAIADEIYKTETAIAGQAQLMQPGGAKSVSIGSVSISSSAPTMQEYKEMISNADTRYNNALSMYARIYHGGSWPV